MGGTPILTALVEDMDGLRLGYPGKIFHLIGSKNVSCQKQAFKLNSFFSIYFYLRSMLSKSILGDRAKMAA